MRQFLRFLVLPTYLTILALSMVLSTQSVFAYALLGGRWANQPRSGCCLRLGIILEGPMYSYDLTGWNNGISAWNGSLANVYYTKVSYGQSTIGATDTSNSGVGWDGLTNLSPGPGGPTYTAATLYVNQFYTQHYSTGEIQSVSTHELGHLNGLAHVSSCVLMNPYTSGSGGRYTQQCGYINTPRSDDINGVNAQY